MNVLIVAALPGAIALLWLLAALSRRLGAVTKQPPLYRLFYLSMALISIGGLWQLAAPNKVQQPLIADVLVLIGLLSALFAAWRYWGWLIYE